MKFKVFVSSTAYDLVDLRPEVYHHLLGLGMEPYLSDISESEFRQDPTANSIESCLINLRSSDFVLVILSQRYGPVLDAFGYDVSATHLEFLEADALNIKVLFYVRDRLMAEFNTWRKNHCPTDPAEIKKFLSWTPGGGNQQNALALFKFIFRRWEFNQVLNQKNWIQDFRNSVDLKSIIAKDLSSAIKTNEFRNAVINGTLPAIVLQYKFESSTTDLISLSLFLKNQSSYPSYSINLSCSVLEINFECPYLHSLSDQPVIFLNIPPNSPVLEFCLTYHTASGFRLAQTFYLSCRLDHFGSAFVSIQGSARNYIVPSEVQEQFIIESDIKN